MSVFLLKAIIRGVAALPLSTALKLGRGIGWFYGQVLRHRRAYVLDALQRSFPKKPPAEIRRIANQMYAHLALNTVEIARLAGGRGADLDGRIEVRGEEIVQSALQQNKGVLILTAHFGNWDLLGMYTVKKGYPLTIISKVIKNKALNDVWMDLRKEYGVNILPADNAFRPCLKALKRNELIGFILDQNRPSGEGIFVDFFGRPASTTPGLAFMAAQSQAPVVPVFIHRTPDLRHVLEVQEAIPPPADREPATIQAATQLYTRIIEDEIRRFPAQWLWVHKRWKHQPAPAAAGGAPSSPAGA